jgi:hypothetical protein
MISFLFSDKISDEVQCDMNNNLVNRSDIDRLEDAFVNALFKLEQATTLPFCILVGFVNSHGLHSFLLCISSDVLVLQTKVSSHVLKFVHVVLHEAQPSVLLIGTSNIEGIQADKLTTVANVQENNSIHNERHKYLSANSSYSTNSTCTVEKMLSTPKKICLSRTLMI